MLKEVCGPLAARWITCPEPLEKDGFDTVWFRREFVSNPAEPLQVLVSACSRYRLFMNGELIALGPCKGGSGYQFIDPIDLSGALRPGRNWLLAEVVSFPDGAKRGLPTKGPDFQVSLLPYAALLLEGRTASGEVISTGSDGWTCWRCRAMTPVRNDDAFWLGYTERVDDHLQYREEDPREWSAAIDCGRALPDQWGVLTRLPLYLRPIPPLEIGAPQAPRALCCEDPFANGDRITIKPHQAMAIDFDAGEETTALVGIAGSGGGGATIRIRYAEAYLHPGADGSLRKADRLPGGDGVLVGYADELLLSGRAFAYSPFWMRTFRFIRLEIETRDEPLELSSPSYRVFRYPLEVVSDVLHDDSGWIDKLWTVSLRTLRCCMHETYEDCPYYEQMQYTMDTRLQMLFTYRVASDARMAARTLFDFHASRLPSGMIQSRCPSCEQQVIPAFSLHWILMLHDYYWQTGDAGAIRDYFSTMDGILRYFQRHRGESGLVEHLGYWTFIDWVEEWRNGVPAACADGPEASHNFLYAYALQVAAALASVIGYKDVAESYLCESGQILELADRAFFDAPRGLYRCGLTGSEYAQQAQVWAVLAGVRDANFRTQLMKTMNRDGSLLPCSFPMQFYLFRAYEAAGLYGDTEKLWSLWQGTLAQNLTTLPEIPVNARSDCHAWSALLLYEYPARMLGVEPASPGWQTIRVCPQALYLGRAKGRASVPDGHVNVDWAVDQGELRVDVALHTDIPVRLELPDGRALTGSGRGSTLSASARLN